MNKLLASDKAQEIIVIKEIENQLYVLSELRKDEETQDIHITSKHHIKGLRVISHWKQFVKN
jgi:hypothetical protein